MPSNPFATEQQGQCSPETAMQAAGFASGITAGKGALAMAGRILIVDDFAAMRAAVGEIIAGEFEVAGWVARGSEVLAKALALLPQTILLDISLPQISGLALLPSLREALPEVAIIMFTNHNSDVYRKEAFARGADAYVLKGMAGSELLPAIRRGRCLQPS